MDRGVEVVEDRGEGEGGDSGERGGGEGLTEGEEVLHCEGSEGGVELDDDAMRRGGLRSVTGVYLEVEVGVLIRGRAEVGGDVGGEGGGGELSELTLEGGKGSGMTRTRVDVLVSGCSPLNELGGGAEVAEDGVNDDGMRGGEVEVVGGEGGEVGLPLTIGEGTEVKGEGGGGVDSEGDDVLSDQFGLLVFYRVERTHDRQHHTTAHDGNEVRGSGAEEVSTALQLSVDRRSRSGEEKVRRWLSQRWCRR